MNARQPPAEVREGDVLAGKYRVERVIGSGGMGVVVQATHLGLKDRVALKFLRFPLNADEETLERFQREALIAAQIKSPHVARVLDVGTLDSGSPYTVMEFLEGENLDQMLKVRGAFELELGLNCVLQACEALASAHAAGVVHRDIKPSNLFVTRGPDDSPLLKVLDFGISKPPGFESLQDLTASDRSMGTPLYMSPEQMRSAKTVDARADIWSLGVVAYELMTGSLPFKADNLPVLCALVLDLDQPAPEPKSLRPDLPEPVNAAILRCLDKDPEGRCPNVAEFALAIAPFAGELGEITAARISRIVAKSSTPAPAEQPRLATPPAAKPATEPTLRVPTSVMAADAAAQAARVDTMIAFGHTQPQANRRRAVSLLLGGATLAALALAAAAGVFSGPHAGPSSSPVESASRPNAAMTPTPTANPVTAPPSVSAAIEVSPVASGSASPAAVARSTTQTPKLPPKSRTAKAPRPATAPDDDVLLLRQ